MNGRLPHDSFQFYVSLGDGRSYRAVAQRFGVSKRCVTKRAAAEDWSGRLERIERTARDNADRKAAETLEAMSERHLTTLRVIQRKALETLGAMPLSSAMEAVRALDLAIRQERTIRGEPSDRTAVSVEDAIKREYERWMATKNEQNEENDDDGDEPVDLRPETATEP